MLNDTFGDLVLCPGCGTIQDASEVCIKCGTLLLKGLNKGLKTTSSKEKGKAISKEKEKAISKEKEKTPPKEKTASLLETPTPQKKAKAENTKVSLLTLRKANKSKTVPRKRHGR